MADNVDDFFGLAVYEVQVCLDMLPIFCQRLLWLWHLLFQLFQVTTLLLNLAGIAHVVDATSAGYSKSVLISIVHLLMSWLDLMLSSYN